MDAAIPFSSQTSGGASQFDFFASLSQQQQPQQHQQQYAKQPSDPRRVSNDSPTRTSLEYGRRPLNDIFSQPQYAGTSQQQKSVHGSEHQSRPSISSVISLNSSNHSPRADISLLDTSPTGLPPPLLPSIQQQTVMEPTPQPKDPPTAVNHKFNSLATRKWTSPSLFNEIPPTDPVTDALHRVFPLSEAARPQRRLLKVEDAERQYGPDEALSALVQSNSWRGTAILARNRLVGLQSAPNKVKEIMDWWLVRLVALEKLRYFDILAAEMDRLGDFDAPELRYDSYPDLFPGMAGTMVSFELRLFSARAPSLRGGHHESISRLYRLLYECRINTKQFLMAGPTSSDLRLWQDREAHIQLTVAGLMLDLKDYRLAISILQGIVQSRPNHADAISALARTYLQLGDIYNAKRLFATAESCIVPQNSEIAPGSDEAIIQCERPELVLSNRAFVAIADNDWESAVKYFTNLLNLPDRTGARTATVMNNLAVCHLYTGNVSQSLSFLETVSVEMPSIAGGCAPLLFNLATLYDLADQSMERKRRMLGTVVAAGAGDDLDPGCLKM
jgi:tetratricopeptide (TPR) repeat protein